MAEPLMMIEAQWQDVCHCLRETADADKSRARKIRETAEGLTGYQSESMRTLARHFDNQAARFLALETELQTPDQYGRVYF